MKEEDSKDDLKADIDEDDDVESDVSGSEEAEVFPIFNAKRDKLINLNLNNRRLGRLKIHVINKKSLVLMGEILQFFFFE